MKYLKTFESWSLKSEIMDKISNLLDNYNFEYLESNLDDFYLLSPRNKLQKEIDNKIINRTNFYYIQNIENYSGGLSQRVFIRLAYFGVDVDDFMEDLNFMKKVFKNLKFNFSKTDEYLDLIIHIDMSVTNTFENFRGWSVSKLSNFSVEDLEDLLEEFQDVAENYGLKDYQKLKDESDEESKGYIWPSLCSSGKSFYYVNTARNAFIQVIYFGLDKEEFIDDLKSFVNKMRSLNNWEIINSWSYHNGFSCEYGENENGDEYVHCDLVFHKKVNEGFFDFFKKKESEDDKIAIEFIQRLEKIKGDSPYEITDITYGKVPSWCYELPKSEDAEYYNKIYLVKFDDLDLIITNDRHTLVDNRTGQRVGEEKCKNQWKLLIGNDEIAERINAKESIRKKIFELVDSIYKRDKEVKRINKIKREINPEADLL